MKTQKTLWIRILATFFLAGISAMGILYSCEKEIIQPTSKNNLKENSITIPSDEARETIFICGKAINKDLIDSENHKIGKVTVSNDAKYFYVRIIAQPGYALASSYLYTGLDSNLPMDMNGDLNFSAFNSTILAREYIRERNFSVPLRQLPDDFTASLMVQVANMFDPDGFVYRKTAWADGELIGNVNRGRFFTYRKANCQIQEYQATPE